jgi:aerobic carbon-monoxide dehydrogenase small subunit
MGRGSREIMKQQLNFKVNGDKYEFFIDSNRTLLEVLRNELGLTGVKDGCQMGECGACTVLVNGRAVNSCLMLALEADGKEVTTIEGLTRGKELDPVQKSFIEKGAIQCGFCSPGMIISAKSLLEKNPEANEGEIKNGLRGNLCRCTGYVKIIDAVRSAGQEMKGGKTNER